MLKLFGRQSVEYPNVRSLERKNYTRFEVVRPRMCETPPTVSDTLLNSNSRVADVQEQHEPDTQVIAQETALTPVSVSDNLDDASEVSPSILKAALPMRFAQMDAVQGPSSIHDAFKSHSD